VRASYIAGIISLTFARIIRTFRFGVRRVNWGSWPLHGRGRRVVVGSLAISHNNW
jgi:hypothetical protein